jgi:hypothetical protein
MMRGFIFGDFMPFMMMLRVLPFLLISTLVVLVVVFWAIYGVNKFRWARTTAIVLSSILGFLLLSQIAIAACRGLMQFGGAFHRGMLNDFSGLKQGIRRF